MIRGDPFSVVFDISVDCAVGLTFLFQGWDKPAIKVLIQRNLRNVAFGKAGIQLDIEHRCGCWGISHGSMNRYPFCGTLCTSAGLDSNPEYL